MLKQLFKIGVISVLFVSCGSVEVNESAQVENVTVEGDSTEIELTDDVVGEIEEPIEEATEGGKVSFKKYNGSWFSIEYPSNFIASPLEPIQTWDEYEHVETEEAFFTSPDGTMVFYVYSPQWGGETSYTERKENEELVSEDASNGDEKELIWVTYKDKEGSYVRSVYSQKTESTHLELYKHFKSSLMQFAD